MTCRLNPKAEQSQIEYQQTPAILLIDPDRTFLPADIPLPLALDTPQLPQNLNCHRVFFKGVSVSRCFTPSWQAKIEISRFVLTKCTDTFKESPVTRKGRAITLSVSDRQKAQLEQIALALGATWGENPNISKLVKDIAAGKLRVAANHDWTSDRINTLNQARNLLVDAGQIDRALELAHLLLERSELSIPLRQEIQDFIEKPAFPWRIEIERYIKRQRPFQLTYQDAAGRIWNFTIRHAQIMTHEERQYLDCWCDETEGNRDLPELIHNWSLRLDRIPEETAVSATSGSWRSALSAIAVEMHLSRGLAFAYQTKTTADVVNDWHPELPNVRQVIRNVTNTFWFFREVKRYSPDCVIVSPEQVRDRYKQVLLEDAAQYGLLLREGTTDDQSQ